MNRHLLKTVDAQNREYRVYAHFQGEFLAYNEQDSVYSDRAPDLSFDRIGFPSEEYFDP